MHDSCQVPGNNFMDRRNLLLDNHLCVFCVAVCSILAVTIFG